MQSVYRWKFIWAQPIDTLIKLGPERKSEVVVIPVLQAPLIIKFLPIVRSFVRSTLPGKYSNEDPSDRVYIVGQKQLNTFSVSIVLLSSHTDTDKR